MLIRYGRTRFGLKPRFSTYEVVLPLDERLAALSRALSLWTLLSERPAVFATMLSRSAAVFRRRSSLFSAGLSHTGEAFFPLRSQKKPHLFSYLSLSCVTASCCGLSSICSTVRASSTRFSTELTNQHGHFTTIFQRLSRLYKRQE